MTDTKNELDKNTFGDSKADSILAKKLSQECNKNLTSYVSRNLLSLTKKLKQISKIDLTERDSFYEMVRKSFISNSKNNHWVEKYPYVLSYFTNCGVKRIRNHKKGLLAQLAEHDPYKVKVDGSIPSQPTIAQAIARAELLLELLQVFNDYDVPLTMTAEQVRDILEEYLTKKD